MPRSRDLLQRFRPAGSPGAAATTGVPADRVSEIAAELEPVLALLADVEGETRRIKADARQEAERRRDEARQRARDRVATARREAEAERADAAARVTRRAENEAAATLSAGEREVEVIRIRVAERLPGYVHRVLLDVRRTLTGETP